MITFTEYSEIGTDFELVNISKYSNVLYEGDQRSVRYEKLLGNWFVIDINSYTYYHFIFDQVGQFLALKSLIPNLKLLIRLKKQTLIDEDPKKFTAWCYEKLALELGEDLIFIEIEALRSLYIENLCVSSNALIDFYRLMDVERVDRLNYHGYQDFVIPELRAFFMRHITVPEQSKKIYISNKSKMSQVRSLKKYVEYVKALGVIWDPTPMGEVDWNHKASTKPSDPNGIFSSYEFPEEFDFINKDLLELEHLEIEANSRYISEEDEDRLENFFLANGYEVIDHSNMPYESQIEVCMSASHYATLTGSSVLNSIFCKKDADIYVLDLEPSRHKIVHEYTPTVVSTNVHVVFSNQKDLGLPRTRFSLDQMIKRLEEIGV